MTEIIRIKINWTGFTGAPGYTNLYFRDFTDGPVNQAMADGAMTKVSTFLTGIKNIIPTTVTLAIDPIADVLEETTGELTNSLTIVPPAPVVGGATGVYSAASGVCISWTTAGIRNGRRIRGRTFLVPLGGTQYDTNGTIVDTTVTLIRNQANLLRTQDGTGDLGIWARPTSKGATDGVWYLVNGAAVKDKVAILRSRRD